MLYSIDDIADDDGGGDAGVPFAHIALAFCKHI